MCGTVQARTNTVCTCELLCYICILSHLLGCKLAMPFLLKFHQRHLRNNLMSLISITNPLANPNICVIQLFFSSLIVLTIIYHLLTDHHCQWGANSHLYSWVCLLWKVQLIILAYQNLENIASRNQQLGFIWIYNYVPGTCIASISCLLSAQQHKGGQTASTLWLQY